LKGANVVQVHLECACGAPADRGGWFLTVCNKFLDLLPHRDFFVKIIESFVPQGKEHGEREREKGRERERFVVVVVVVVREREGFGRV
jgi:hypothetical protein